MAKLSLFVILLLVMGAIVGAQNAPEPIEIPSNQAINQPVAPANTAPINAAPAFSNVAPASNSVPTSSHTVGTELRIINTDDEPDLLMGEQFDIEVHFIDTTNSNQSVFSGYADFNFDSAFLQYDSITYGPNYSYLQIATPGTNIVEDIGGTSSQTSAVADTLVATLTMTVLQTGNTSISLAPPDNLYAETTIYGNDNDQRTNTSFSSQSLTLGPCADCMWSNVNLIDNGDFGTGGILPWGLFGDYTHQINSGALEFYRAASSWRGAIAFQNQTRDFEAGSPMRLNIDLGNTSAVAKPVEVLVRNSSFTDYISCAATIPAGAALQTMTIEGVTNMAWGDTTVAVRDLSRDGTMGIRMDNVSLEYLPNSAISGFSCTGFSAPTNQNLVLNGDFSNFRLHWILWGDYTFINPSPGGSQFMQFYRPAGASRPAALLSEPAHNVEATSPLRLTLDIGNSSSSTKDVQVTLRDDRWSEAFACTYTVSPGTPLTTVTIEAVTTTEWTNPLVLVGSNNTDGTGYIEVDNASLTHIPGMIPTSQCSPTTLNVPNNVVEEEKSFDNMTMPEVISEPPAIPEIPSGGPVNPGNDNPGGGMPTVPGF